MCAGAGSLERHLIEVCRAVGDIERSQRRAIRLGWAVLAAAVAAVLLA